MAIAQRTRAANVARGSQRTVASGEELEFGTTFAASFHKGLPHSPTGFVDTDAYRSLVEALLHQEHARFEGLPAGKNFPSTSHPRRTIGTEDYRKFTSPFTGHAYDLQGADAGALGLNPAPTLASDEFAAEMAELYVMALLRDESFEDIVAGSDPKTQSYAALLASMPWFSDGSPSLAIGSRRRRISGPADLFRGSTPGSRTGPWLSQFLLVGNQWPGGDIPGPRPAAHRRVELDVTDGYVYYGTQFVDQRSVVASPGVDWLQSWPSWLDAQNGVDFNGKDRFEARRAFLSSPRDLATYVHFDALYQAYQVACLLMIAEGSPFGRDRGMPETFSRTRSAFASFGGPHILSLVTEVATRALKHVWRQKWQHHRRLRPEVAAGLLTLWANAPDAIPNDGLRNALAQLHAKLPAALLEAVATHNNTAAPDEILPSDRIPSNGNTDGLPDIGPDRNYLLPMAFPEGSPMHPAYGAGHATVAGACVTALKAFFEMYQPDGVTELGWPLAIGCGPGGLGRYGFGCAYVGKNDRLKSVPGGDELTLQGELDKLAANVAIGRNMAGVHYYTDYFASVRMGERVTVSILEEQLALFNEPTAMHFTSFDGDRIRIRGAQGQAHVSVVDRDGHSVDAVDWYQRFGS